MKGQYREIIKISPFPSNLPAATAATSRILQAETGLVPLGDLCPRSEVEQVIVNESLEGMEVVVAGVEFPLVPSLVGEEIRSAPVHREAVETKQVSQCVWTLTFG